MIEFVGGLSAGLHTVSVLSVTVHEKAAWIGVCMNYFSILVHLLQSSEFKPELQADVILMQPAA